MIISLSEAQELNPKLTQLELDAYEQHIRSVTNNNFNHKSIKTLNVGLTGNLIILPFELVGVQVGDTVEVFGSRFNDGLYVVADVKPYEIAVEAEFTSEITIRGGVVKVVYPDDVKVGLMNVIKYDMNMADKVGVKSESVGRMSKTYYDSDAKEQWNFLTKYNKIRW